MPGHVTSKTRPDGLPGTVGGALTSRCHATRLVSVITGLAQQSASRSASESNGLVLVLMSFTQSNCRDAMATIEPAVQLPLALHAIDRIKRSGPSLLPEQPLQLRLSLIHFPRVGSRVGARPGLEVIAEVRLRLVADFLRRGLAAMLCNARVVLDAHLAHVQLGTALGALVEPPQRQTQMRQRSTAIPADEVVTHGTKFTPFA